jgi:CHAT domain-containing protein
VHLATHGWTDAAVPLASGLLLAATSSQQGGPGTDGVLEAWEIQAQLRLQAELVVLSACDTARGSKVRGEGLVGLIRAVQTAGASAVVASLWRVSDESTATLMTSLHRGLRAGMAKDQALRRAMVEVRQHPETRHPRFWAPFVLCGDPSPLSSRGRLQR